VITKLRAIIEQKLSLKFFLGLLRSYFGIALFIAGLLIVSGFGFVASIRAPIVLLVISFVGLVIWLAILDSERSISFPEALGIGLSLGLIVCALAMFCLKPFGFAHYGATVPVAITGLALCRTKFQRNLNFQRLNFDVHGATIPIFSVFLGLGLSYPELLVPSAVVGLILLRSSTKKIWGLEINFLVLWLTVLLTLVFLSVNSNAAPPYVFSFGSESIPRAAWTESVLGWGPSENIALFGNPLRYHWFSFAVFGMLSRLFGITTLAFFHSGLLAVIDLICIGSLVWGLTMTLAKSRTIALLSVTILLGTVSLNNTFAVFTDSSPDATSWLVWVTALAFVLFSSDQISKRFFPIVLATLGSVIMLSNGGYGAAVAVGLVFWLIGTQKSNSGRLLSSKKELIAFCLTGMSMLVVYQQFLTPSSYSTSTLDLSTRFLFSAQGALFVCSFYLARLAATTQLKRLFPTPTTYFFAGIATASIPSFFVYRNSTFNLTYYFAFPALVLFPIPMAMLFQRAWASKQKTATNLALTMTFFGLGWFLQILFTAIQWKHYERFGSLQLSEYLVIVPPIAILTTATVLAIFKPEPGFDNSYSFRRLKESFKSIFIVSTVACSLGLGLGYSLRMQVRQVVDRQSGIARDTEAPKPLISYEFEKAMIWLRQNSDKDDKVATNWLCGVDTRTFFTNCQSNNSRLGISAIANRRVLIEGDAWANVGLVFTKTRRLPVPIEGEGTFTTQIDAPQWILDRISMSHRFAKSADAISANYLKSMDIEWFVVDKSKKRPRTWEPFADVVFENSEVIILRTNFNS